MIIFTESKSFILSKLEGIRLTKLYYSIGEVAAIFEVNTSLLRFWEKEFGISNLKKNKKGERLFTVKDIEYFNKIYHLVKNEGYTLDGAKKALKTKTVTKPVTSNSPSNDQLIKRLEKIKDHLLSLKGKDEA
jgi:DNA-binding transcriptional MerR regulator